MHALDLDGMLRRLHLPTVRRLYPECEVRAEAEDQSYRDFLATLIAEEVAHRAQTRIERSVRKARFPFLRTIEDFDFTFQTSIRLQLLGSCLGPELVSEGRSLILCGPTGTGKTHLGIAIAYRAIQNGYEALFTSAAEMIETLSVAARGGELAKTLAHYTHPPVLIIDEVGYLTVGGDAANLMFQVVNERYLHRRPMLFTTNKPLAAWGLVLHDPDLAEAILDRVLERGRLVELRGASYRTRHIKRVESDRSPGHRPAGISGNHRQEFPEPTRHRHPHEWVQRVAGVDEPFPVREQAAQTILRLRRRVDGLAACGILQRGAGNATDRHVDSLDSRADEFCHAGCDGAIGKLAVPLEQRLAIAQRFPRGGVGAPAVIQVLEHRVRSRDDVLDLGAGLRFQQRQRIDEHRRVWDEICGSSQARECGSRFYAGLQYSSRFQLRLRRKLGKLVEGTFGLPLSHVLASRPGAVGRQAMSLGATGQRNVSQNLDSCDTS